VILYMFDTGLSVMSAVPLSQLLVSMFDCKNSFLPSILFGVKVDFIYLLSP